MSIGLCSFLEVLGGEKINFLAFLGAAGIPQRVVPSNFKPKNGWFLTSHHCDTDYLSLSYFRTLVITLGSQDVPG